MTDIRNGHLAESTKHPIGLNLTALASLYRDELLQQVLPFWLQNSPDKVNGGYYTCIDKNGKVFDRDKFMWLQGRQVWCFSHMYKNVEGRQEWLEMALLGARFMQKHGRDENGNWYFSLTEDGRPLVQPYNIFSDCFAAMAFAALDKICPKDEYKEIALTTFENILQRQHNWKGSYNKNVPGTRPIRSFSLPMILCNLSLEMEQLLGTHKVDALIPSVIEEVMNVFYQPDFGLTLENVQADGKFSDSFEGRLVNPGHSIEAMWFIMDLGKRQANKALVETACDRLIEALEYGWDQEYGGIFYFKDVLGHPPQQLEWDQKLWWVHVESLVALAKAYALTGEERFASWFNKVHDYTWNHFRDIEQGGEWFGYLNRQGEVLLDLKGGKWKGCFHVPRGLYQVWKTLENVDQLAVNFNQ